MSSQCFGDRQSTTSSSTSHLKEFGPWTEQYSSSGKRYFYNRESEISQWEKPAEWRDYEKMLAENAITQSPISSASGARAAATNSGNAAQGGATAVSNSISNNEAKARVKAREVPTTSIQAPRAKRPKVEQVNEDLIGPVIFSDEQHRRFLRADAQTSTRRWPTEDWEQAAIKADQAAHNLALQIIYVSCDLKSARALVKTAEMRSSLLARKLNFIADHQRQLEASFTLPSLNNFSYSNNF